MMNGFVESPRRILFVEDNPADVLMLREGFRAVVTDGELVVVENASQALDAVYGRGRYAATPAPDLVLIHSNRSDDAGGEVLAAVKADASLRSIPVLALTSEATDDEIRRMYEMHCNCVIRKPMDLQGYRETVEEIATFWLKIVRLPGAAQLDR